MKYLFFLMTSSLLLLTACNNERKKDTPSAETVLADSLNKLVDDVHIKGMAKMARLSKMQQRTQQLLDSLGKLPAKAQKTAAPVKEKLEGLLKELNYADFAMDKWMTEFYVAHKDTLKDKLSARIEYLRDQQTVAGKVTDAILGSLQKGDSLLQQIR
ncbi:MAG: hypothetical protein QM781_18770 [Chitinophagaceae bacterium]